jgi:hypothetical protein
MRVPIVVVITLIIIFLALVVQNGAEYYGANGQGCIPSPFVANLDKFPIMVGRGCGANLAVTVVLLGIGNTGGNTHNQEGR